MEERIEEIVDAITKIDIPSTSEPKISALSLSSIRAKRELEKTSKATVREVGQHLSEPFNETDMLLQWNKYAQKLGDKGLKIMESLLLNNDPVLNGTTITVELASEGAKIDFETELNGLLGHLKGHLHNHDITIELIVNEKAASRRSYTSQERYNRLNEINPNLDLLRSTFGVGVGVVVGIGLLETLRYRLLETPRL